MTLLWPAGAARGAIGFHSCPKLRGTDFRCASIQAPLDYSGQAKGSLTLDVRLLKAVGTRRGTMVTLSGGPGQAGIGDPSYDVYLRSLMRGWDVIELDQRGTGARALRCPTLDKLDVDIQQITAADLTQRYVQCAAALGPNRRFYTSIDSARDIDALRVQLGLEKIAIGGTSYGTFVTQMYARLFPQRVDRMLLDSVVPPQGVQAIYLDSFAASRRILAAQCAGRRCQGITSDLSGDIGRLQQEMLEAPLTGRRVARLGR